MKRFAQISEDKKYRYLLIRDWSNNDSLKTVAFIGLNPSTADAENDDPTIRRCIGFAKSWGYNCLMMVNLFALRATNPSIMKNDPFPFGEHNYGMLTNIHSRASLVIAAWGNHGAFKGVGFEWANALRPLYHLGLTKSGHPKHPLYLKKDVKPQPYILETTHVNCNG